MCMTIYLIEKESESQQLTHTKTSLSLYMNNIGLIVIQRSHSSD